MIYKLLSELFWGVLLGIGLNPQELGLYLRNFEFESIQEYTLGFGDVNQLQLDTAKMGHVKHTQVFHPAQWLLSTHMGMVILVPMGSQDMDIRC